MSDKKHDDDNKLIAERRGKLDALRETGNAFPNDFHRLAYLSSADRDSSAGCRWCVGMAVVWQAAEVAGDCLVFRYILKPLCGLEQDDNKN